MRYTLALVLLGTLAGAARLPAQAPPVSKTEDVIYGRKHGLALTMDVYAPKDPDKANGAAVVYCVSGGWFSAKEWVAFLEPNVRPFVARGYTVFAVLHGSQPRFTVPEVLDDMHRAVRFIKSKAKAYKIDPDRIGVTGISAGGHLSLMQGTAPKAGDPDAPDPVDRLPSKVAAVGAFCPPTDFFNWSGEGVEAQPGKKGPLSPFRAPFDFVELNDKAKAYDPVTDPGKRKAIFKAISPITHVTKDDAPAIIFHGDKDGLVPVFQAERMAAKLKDTGVPCELVIKKGAAHVWAGMDKDFVTVADWFDKHMPKK